jgi:hypothetical protein
MTSGLNAIAFWVIRGDFDPTWWIPNLYLLIYPFFFLPQLLRPTLEVSRLEVRS